MIGLSLKFLRRYLRIICAVIKILAGDSQKLFQSILFCKLLFRV